MGDSADDGLFAIRLALLELGLLWVLWNVDIFTGVVVILLSNAYFWFEADLFIYDKYLKCEEQQYFCFLLSFKEAIINQINNREFMVNYNLR